MTEQEFAAIKERWGKMGGAYPNRVHLDIAALIKAVEERDAIIHDLQLDGAGSHERIRQAERGEVVGCLRYLLQRKKRQRKAVDLHDIETQIIGCRGIVSNPLPPDQVRQENERLRSALKAIRDQADGWINFVNNCSGPVPTTVSDVVRTFQEMARKGLGEA